LERIAKKVAFERKDMPQDEWITDPQDERLANPPEWVPRPGETALIEWSRDFGPVETTVKAVKKITDDFLDLDTGPGKLSITYSRVYSIGKRYVQPGYPWN